MSKEEELLRAIFEESPRPKPGPPSRVLVEETKKVAVSQETKERPKFVRKPHLTERPFKGHAGLEELQKQLEQKSSNRGQRRTNKEKK